MLLQRHWLYGVIGLAVIAVFATAVGLYLVIGSRGEPAPVGRATMSGPSPAMTPPTATPAAAVPSIEAAAERLAARLNANNGTGDDWALLARSYVQMHRYPEAVAAFEKALQKMPGNQAFIEEQAAARKAITAPASK